MKRTFLYCLLLTCIVGCHSSDHPEKAAPLARIHLKRVDTVALLKKIKTADSANDKELMKKYGRYKGPDASLRALDSLAHMTDSVLIQKMRHYRKHHADTVLKKA